MMIKKNNGINERIEISYEKLLLINDLRKGDLINDRKE